ncbi:Hemolysin-type calcium-binding repeat-containing protein [Albimonas donghaensis]|uniref:Hemolysin-type calcium-binding repeat-containing protein n=1 Tax=Albimonas donghaensis TaxID=356660 RepID=A0A1H2YMY7_9RHOB|nr:calcium-binding protein [Albimonas donghaensis]SDX06546.1 Hemolysin-type calcium-binding repeat-containing protein [Albimonas donghaensis]
MSVSQSLSSIEATHGATLGAFGELESLRALVQGTGEDDAEPRSFEEVLTDWSPLLIRVGVYGGAELLLMALDAHIDDLKRDYRAQLREFHNKVGEVAETAEDGELLMLVGGALPGIGPTISRLGLRQAMGRIEVSGEDLEARGISMDQSLSQHIERLERLHTILENLVRVVEVVDAVLTVYGILPAAIEPALEWMGFASDPDVDPLAAMSVSGEIGVADAEAAPVWSDTDLSDNARMEAGFAAFALRFDAETSDYTGIIDAMTQAVAPVQAAIETIIDPAVEGLDAALEFIEDLVEPIDFLEGLEALARPFISAVSTMASPINAFFDFLEDPPRVFGIRVFPAIPRSAIDAILDFLDALNGVVQEAVEFFLGDLLRPIQNAANAILDKLIPIDEFLAPVNAAIAALTSLADVMEGLIPDVPDLGVDDILDRLAAATAPSLEAFAVSDGDLQRNVFFGASEGETVVGLTLAETEAAAGEDGDLAAASAETSEEGVEDESPTDPDPVPGAVLAGGGGDDHLTGTALADFLLGGTGDDTLIGLAGDDAILGGAGDDEITGGLGDDAIDGGLGEDRALFAGSSADYTFETVDGVLYVDGEDGRDSVVGVETLVFANGAFNAGLFAPDTGGAGDDVIVRGAGADRLKGGAGEDELRGGAGRDTLKGGADGDYLNGGRGQDVLKGQAGDDFLFGGPGPDNLFGGGGNDTLDGGPGRDKLVGGLGDDLLIGGKGADLMVFRGRHGTDTIEDFGLGADQMQIRGLRDFADLTITRDGADSVIEWRDLTIIVADLKPREIDEDHFLL